MATANFNVGRKHAHRCVWNFLLAVALDLPLPIHQYSIQVSMRYIILMSFSILQGQNLILNMNDHGFVVCAYNSTVAKVDHFLENEAKGHLHVSYSKYRGLQVGCLQKANRQWLSST